MLISEGANTKTSSLLTHIHVTDVIALPPTSIGKMVLAYSMLFSEKESKYVQYCVIRCESASLIEENAEEKEVHGYGFRHRYST